MKYKLSRNIKAQERTALEGAGNALKSALRGIAKAEKVSSELMAKLGTLEARERALDAKAGSGDESASSALLGVRDQIGRLNAEIARNENAAADLGAINTAVVVAADILRGICPTDIRKQIDDMIEERNADFFENRAGARKVSFDCDAARVLNSYFGVSGFSTMEARLAEAARFLAVIEGLLRGDAIWEFPLPQP
jgi:hypothetical protein